MVGNDVAIVTDEPGWHGRQLERALESSNFGCVCVSLMDCEMCINGRANGLVLPGFDKGAPAGLFVRGVPGGTLEQVIFRLNVLHGLKRNGIVVYNDPRAIERTVDKSLTSSILAQGGLPTPRTWVCESTDRARAILRRETDSRRNLVQKPLFGSQGMGLRLVNRETGLAHDEGFAGVYYLQEFVDRPNGDWFDIRVLVVDGRARAAMKRRADSWLTNRAQGAVCERADLDGQMAGLAEEAVALLDMDYAGVDLIPDTDGVLHVIEVNSIPAWYGLQKVTGFDIAGCLVDSFVNRIRRSQPPCRVSSLK